MRLIQIEGWALRVTDDVDNNRPSEDARVELKAEWPLDAAKTARQLAGQANAARGEPILWLIGVDQLKGVTGVEHTEISSWLPRIRAYFDGIFPDVIDLNVPVKGKTIVALFFDTTRAPFLVKNPGFGKQGGGSIAREIPWREGSSTRTATRDEVIRIISPLQQSPYVELLKGKFMISAYDNNTHFTTKISLYITPRNQNRIVFPFHQCSASFEMSNQTSPVLFESFHLIPPYAIGVSGGEIRDLSLTVKSTSSEVIMNGPGMVNAEASLKIQPKKSLLDYNGIDVTVRFVLSSIDLDSSINITALLRQEQPFDINVDNIGQALNDKGRWFLVSQSVSYQNH